MQQQNSTPTWILQCSEQQLNSLAAACTVDMETLTTKLGQAPASPLPPGAVWGQGVETVCSLLGGPGWGWVRVEGPGQELLGQEEPGIARHRTRRTPRTT